MLGRRRQKERRVLQRGKAKARRMLEKASLHLKNGKRRRLCLKVRNARVIAA
jgi:hypothetical protein